VNTNRQADRTQEMEMKTYMVTATIKGKFCNGMSHNGNLYDINPTVGKPVKASSPEEAIEIYKRTGAGKLSNFAAYDYEEFMNGKNREASDDCPF
jgi:hypothetical protein